VIWGVAVEKLLRPKFAKNKTALGRPTNDLLNFLDILYPLNFGCLGGTWTFSTATGFIANYRKVRRVLYAESKLWAT